MLLTGTLRTWHDDRGFGFIAPTGGGREIFVHVSAFPGDGSRPTVGERLSYETAPGKDGQIQAVRVTRLALGERSSYPARRALPAGPRRSGGESRWSGRLILGLILFGLGAYGYTAYRRASAPSPSELQMMDLALHTPAVQPTQPAAEFRCDGRTRCEQMKSCEEARYFLANCPGTQMDGNNDGEPCEQQWCGR